LPQSVGVRRPTVMCCWKLLRRKRVHALDLGKTRAQYFMLDPSDGFVAVDVLLRQQPDDEEDDEEEEDRSHDEDEDDDYGNDDGYSE
jgi:hypothetical protein